MSGGLHIAKISTSDLAYVWLTSCWDYIVAAGKASMLGQGIVRLAYRMIWASYLMGKLHMPLKVGRENVTTLRTTISRWAFNVG